MPPRAQEYFRDIGEMCLDELQHKPVECFKEAVQAAGRTKVICAGGKEMAPEEFLAQLHEQFM